MYTFKYCVNLYTNVDGHKFISSSAWTQEKEKAMAAIRKDIDFTANGFDIDPMVIDTAKRNADRASAADGDHDDA